MGLFSSKKYYFAHAGSSSLYEETPDTVESQILQTAMGNEGTMSGAIRFAIGTDTFARAKSMMRYAERGLDPARDGGYIRGFPTSNLDLVIVEPSQIEAALTRAVGAWDEITFMKAGKYEENFLLGWWLQNNYPNAPHFNFGAAPADPEWHPEDATVTIPVTDSGGVYYEAENDPDIIRFAPNITFPDEDRYEGYLPPVPDYTGVYIVSFPYVDEGGNDATYELSEHVDLKAQVVGDWIMVKYLVGGQTYFWLYEVGSGLDPTLEDHIARKTLEGQFLPVAVLMHDKVWFDDAGPDDPLTITTNKLLKKFSTTADQVKEDFLQAEADNPSEGGEKWDFFIHFAIPIHTKVQGSHQYFFHFFRELQEWQSFGDQAYYDYLDAGGGGGQPINEMNITEAGIDGYNVDYRWSYVKETPSTGWWEVENTDPDKYGPGATRDLREGECTVDIYEMTDTGVEQGYTDAIELAFGPGTPIGTYHADPEKGGYHDLIVVTRQRKEFELDPGVDLVTGQFDQIVIMGLSMAYKINTRDDVTNDYRFRYAIPNLFGDEEETKEFRIPILYRALKEVPVLKREQAVADGFSATVFLVERVKVKWYQRSFFKWLIVIIAVVIIVLAIFMPGFVSLLKIMAAQIAAAVGLAGSAFAMYAIFGIMQFAIGFIISQAAATIGQEFGNTAGLVFSVISAASMFYAAGGFKQLAQSFNSITQNPGWASAVSFINAATPVYNMGWTVYSNYAMYQIQSELEDFLKDAKEKQQQLKDAYDSFGPTPDWIDPMDLVNMFRRIGSTESASSYLNRTLQSNPGVLGYEAIANFPEVALMLPQDLNEMTVIDAMMADFAEQRGQAV